MTSPSEPVCREWNERENRVCGKPATHAVSSAKLFRGATIYKCSRHARRFQNRAQGIFVVRTLA